MTRTSIRVLTLIESNSVTGPARNIIEFGKRAGNAIGEGPQVQVAIATYQRGASGTALAKAATDAGLSVFTIAERRRFDTGVIPQLRNVVAEYQPDILESRNVKSHFLVRLSGLHKQYPWIAWNHGYTETDWLDRAYTQLDRWSLRGAYRVATVCGPFADKLAGLGVKRDNIFVLHNSVRPFAAPPAEEVEQLRNSLGLAGKSVILAVGRLSFEKGHADLLRAAAALDRKAGIPDFQIVIVGDGPERESLSRLASQLGIAHRLTLAGFRRDVGTFYAMATLLAVPSHSEGSPNVVLEAMAAGLPIAATAVGGVPEIVEEGVTGLLVPPLSSEQMADAIERLLRDPELRAELGRAAQECAQTRYTAKTYDESLIRFYRETLG